MDLAVPASSEEPGLSPIENIASRLLAHLSCDVRIAALSLLVSSSSSTRPFPTSVLKILQRYLPYFHVETDAKVRNDFASTIKRLCTRLYGAVLRLKKSPKTQDGPTFQHAYSKGTAVPSMVFDHEPSLGAHIGFARWYITFLSQELHSLTSYQRHISGLKAFSRLHSSGLLLFPEVCPHLPFLWQLKIDVHRWNVLGIC